ncbi:MAG: FAD-dependent oxidoreductase [Mycoplasmataceae bacterium]|nr:FAD-dependent oxidoreductase [Mycoplasmataceae bacterium]
MMEIIIQNNNKIYDFIVIGGGPAGWAAAIYSTRAGLSTVVIEKNAPGGKLINISTVHNYPGSPEIDGKNLALNMFTQATELGTEYVSSEVTSLTKEKDIFIVKTT